MTKIQEHLFNLILSICCGDSSILVTLPDYEMEKTIKCFEEYALKYNWNFIKDEKINYTVFYQEQDAIFFCSEKNETLLAGFKYDTRIELPYV